MKSIIKRNIERIITEINNSYCKIKKRVRINRMLGKFRRENALIPIEKQPLCVCGGGEVTDFWTRHTVRDEYFESSEESMNYRLWIFDVYPHYREFAEMDRKHDNEVILDYGCGPGNDLTWYSQTTMATKIIGMDVSLSSLERSQFRMALHGIDQSRCRLIMVDDNKPIIPLEDESVDFVSCQGVLMHTSYPEEILKEFHRVLRKRDDTDSSACIMVYNKRSIWYHLYASYILRFVDSSNIQCYPDEDTSKLTVDELFTRSTDGPECPMARCWTPEEFIEMCKEAGFNHVKFKGGYPNCMEPGFAKKYIQDALADDRLEENHKAFLRNVEFDKDGYPLYDNMQCCIGGVYHLYY